MLGRLVWTGKWGGWIRLETESVRGLRLLRAELPGRPEGRLAAAVRRRGLLRLEQAGVRRLLEQEDTGAFPLRPVITRPLWQQMAAPLAVAAVDDAGARLERTVIALRGEGVTRPVFQTCCQLIGAVRALSLSIPAGGEELAWWLEREYGVPVLAEGGDVTLCFSPDEGGKDRFLLGEEQPRPQGYTLALKQPGQTPLPESCPSLPLLAALLEEQRLNPEELRVVSVSAAEKGKKNGNFT